MLALASLVSGCYSMRPSQGGGQTAFSPPRRLDARDIAVPAGYRVELVASGLTFPTGVAFDPQGTPYVTESGYSYGEAFTTPRLLRVGPGGQLAAIATGHGDGPWNGVTYADGAFYVAAGGELRGGRILRITPDGHARAITPTLPSMGDHHVDGPLADGRGNLYFTVGTATNSGVVGPDNAQFGWLWRHPDFHDVPPRDVVLKGQNFTSENPLRPGERATTGAYLPFGTPSSPGQTIRGRIPAGGALYRIPVGGGRLELVAWGFRNPYGLALSPRGQLYVTVNGYDDRGSRPIFGAGDCLYAVRTGLWYGWPDFSGGKPVTLPGFKAPGKAQPQFLLARHPNPPPAPAAEFGVHSSACGLDFSRSPRFGHVGDAFVAEFGDQAPTVGKVLSPVGFRVVRVEAGTGAIHDFAFNRGKVTGPASKSGGGGFERPLAARFSPSGDALYVVDFGVMTMSQKGPAPRPGTGALWRIVRAGALASNPPPSSVASR
jgi:glucose/arabinose dehydrogenase